MKVNNRLDYIISLMARALALATCAFILVLSSQNLTDTIKYADYNVLRTALARGDFVTLNTLRQYTAGSDLAAKSRNCRRDIVASIERVVLADLDQEGPNIAYEEWAKAMESAERFLKFALSCRPVDGDIWARLALVERTIGDTPESVVSLADMSVKFAPTEDVSITARARLWNTASPSILRLAAPIIDHDLEMIAQFAEPKSIANILPPLISPTFAKALSIHLKTVPKQHLDRLTDASYAIQQIIEASN